MYNKPKIPVMPVGRYAGIPVDQLPNNYLRWLIRQDFPSPILEAAMRKLKASDYNNEYITVSRHALDMYSKRFLKRWVDKFGSQLIERDPVTNRPRIKGVDEDGVDGLATHITKEALQAWSEGADISKHRHQHDGVVKLWGEIQWVFAVSKRFPDYLELITVMNYTKPNKTIDKQG